MDSKRLDYILSTVPLFTLKGWQADLLADLAIRCKTYGDKTEISAWQEELLERILANHLKEEMR